MGHAEILLRAGYGVVMMDARAHGASEGSIATYGWLERNDTRAIIDALFLSERFLVQPNEHVLPGNAPYLNAPLKPRGSDEVHLFALGESMGAGIALQSAAADPRIEAVVAEASFATLREASYDYAGLRQYPWLGKTLFAPFSWTLLYRGEKLAGLPVAEVSTVKAVASRAFPVLLICDEKDQALPCRHTEMIYAAARGPKQMWVVPGAFHTAALGYQPAEFQRRVLAFFATYATAPDNPARLPQTKKAAPGGPALRISLSSLSGYSSLRTPCSLFKVFLPTFNSKPSTFDCLSHSTFITSRMRSSSYIPSSECFCTSSITSRMISFGSRLRFSFTSSARRG
ncbi:MAG: alpha/beta hydrolase, partial [Candidatus Acidiferrum sp.]